jgi:hypothetical protein
MDFLNEGDFVDYQGKTYIVMKSLYNNGKYSWGFGVFKNTTNTYTIYCPPNEKIKATYEELTYLPFKNDDTIWYYKDKKEVKGKVVQYNSNGYMLQLENSLNVTASNKEYICSYIDNTYIKKETKTNEKKIIIMLWNPYDEPFINCIDSTADYELLENKKILDNFYYKFNPPTPISPAPTPISPPTPTSPPPTPISPTPTPASTTPTSPPAPAPTPPTPTPPAPTPTTSKSKTLLPKIPLTQKTTIESLQEHFLETFLNRGEGFYIYYKTIDEYVGNIENKYFAKDNIKKLKEFLDLPNLSTINLRGNISYMVQYKIIKEFENS